MKRGYWLIGEGEGFHFFYQGVHEFLQRYFEHGQHHLIHMGLNGYFDAGIVIRYLFELDPDAELVLGKLGPGGDLYK